jgi:hypothetical protein
MIVLLVSEFEQEIGRVHMPIGVADGKGGVARLRSESFRATESLFAATSNRLLQQNLPRSRHSVIHHSITSPAMDGSQMRSDLASRSAPVSSRWTRDDGSYLGRA